MRWTVELFEPLLSSSLVSFRSTVRSQSFEIFPQYFVKWNGIDKLIAPKMIGSVVTVNKQTHKIGLLKQSDLKLREHTKDISELISLPYEIRNIYSNASWLDRRWNSDYLPIYVNGDVIGNLLIVPVIQHVHADHFSRTKELPTETSTIYRWNKDVLESFAIYIKK